MSKRFSVLLTLLGLLALTAPHRAEARAGSGGSMGSRGTHTYQAMPSTSTHQAAPIQRSMTPQPTAAPRPQAGYNASPMAQPAASPSFFGAHPFLSSMAGGFLGAGLFNMISGHSAMAGTGMDPNAVAGGGGGMGFLLPLLLIGGLGYLAWRFMGQRNGQAGGFAPSFASMNAPQADASFATASPANAIGNDQGTPLTLGQEDYQAFPPLLEKIQSVWGASDLDHLRQYLTPEMVHYFSQELSANSSRGLVNKVEQVKALAGDLIEAWSEDAMDYATVHLKWSAIDYMARLDRQPTDADYVADGSASIPTQAEEVWTFTRARNGGHWLLSAIQQVA